MNDTTIDHGTALTLADPVRSVDLYQTMCAAIAECARVDQVREIRNRAKALEEYTRQSKNFEAEAQLSAIRMRAERRAGELLIQMAAKRERQTGGGDTTKAPHNDNGVLPTISDLGVTTNESSAWQRLAKIPRSEFEKALAQSGVKSTYKVIAAHRAKQATAPMNKHAKQQIESEGNDDSYQRRLSETMIKIADGKVRSLQQISDVTGLEDTRRVLYAARLLPWVTSERTQDGYRFAIDEELRLICEDRAPRPQLNGAGVHAFIKKLAKEIDRKRKENHEKHKAIKWNPDNVSKIEQKRLLDWVESELSKLAQLMASSGPDVTSAIRTQNHPSGDGEREYVSQEEYSNRTINTRAC